MPYLIALSVVWLGIWLVYRQRVRELEREKEARRKKKLDVQTAQEQKEKRVANMEGLSKYRQIELYDAREHRAGVAAMRQLGVIMQQSVYQEKEKDWAVLGGIADGIAGPAAGIMAAANAMQDNAKIRADNAARREWGARQNARFQDFASEIEKESPSVLSMAELQKKYEANLSWAPSTLFSFIKLNDTKTEVDALTGAVTVSTSWSQDDKSICIDGSFRAKLYTNDGKCAGCAYLVLPKTGTARFKGQLSGICVSPKPSASYTVEIEPANLWELSLKEKPVSRVTDNLTVEEHKKLVSDSEAKFLSEVNKS